jgi:dihydropteroate synthase
MRSVFDWNIGSRVLALGKRTLVMGIVNVTPDSFSDGGQFLDPDKAVELALRLLDEGADIIDVGGESTRPGAVVNAPRSPESAKAGSGAGKTSGGGAKAAAETAKPANEKPVSEKPVNEKEERERVIPVITKLKQQRPAAVISVDTYKSGIARAAVEAGAEIVNDVSAFRWDPKMAKTVAELQCGAVLMHMRGRPEEWRSLPPASDIVVLVKRELRDWADAATMAGVKRERILLDPGFGFGKKFEENYPLLRRLDEFHQLRYPLLAGVSRKSFVGRMLKRDGKDAALSDRIYGTVATETVAILKGVHVIRTHDVRACVDAARVADLVV